MVDYSDTRDWIDQAKDVSELKAIKGADTNLEVRTMVQLDAKNEGPALLFDKLEGDYRGGFRILTNFMASIRLFNLTFGLPIANNIRESVENLKEKQPSGRTGR